MPPVGRKIHLTVDLEEWFHLLDCGPGVDSPDPRSHAPRVITNTHRLLDLFDLHEAKATFFALGWVAEQHPALVREILARGHFIGCHSHDHTLVWTQSPEAFRDETARAIRILEDVTGTNVTCYRAPGFSITPRCSWALEILVELGIEVDASLFPGQHAHGGLGKGLPDGPFWIDTPSGALLEFPMSLVSFGPLDLAYAGGGYFRALPWPLIRHWVRRRPYTMTYFHPRDFDPGQPRIPGLSLGRRFKSYFGLASSLSKLDRLLSEFQTVPVARDRALDTAARISIASSA